MPLKNRVPTASERVYREWLEAATDEERANLEGQLVAICITACRNRKLSPPYERRRYSEDRRSGGPFSLPFWVRGWVNDQLSAGPLKDGARFIGRRCVNALIDDIRWHERRKRGAQIRNRKGRDNEPVELERLRFEMRRLLADVGLPHRLRIAGDISLLTLLMTAYPMKLSNASIARHTGLSEGAIRRRRRRISEICFGLANESYQLRSTFAQLGLSEGTKKPA